MIATIEDWTIVLAGAWNNRVFSPVWVGKHLLDTGTVEIQGVIAVGATGFQDVRYPFSSGILIPRDDKIVIGVRETSDEALQAVEALSRKILELLPHTPVNGAGVNFGFRESEPSPKLLRVFTLSDAGSVGSVAGVEQIEIARRLKLESATLNLKLALSEGVVSVNINYHKDTATADEAREWLMGKAVSFKSNALQFLEEIYGLTIEERETIHA